MPNLVVITFDSMEEAGQVRKALSQGQKQGLISLDDSAVVVKDEAGHVNVKNEIDRGVKVGAAAGGLLGLFIGFLLFGPLASTLIGAVGGAGVGALTDLGIEKKFVKEVAKALKPGTSALFIIVRESNATAAMATLKPYQGEVYHTSLPPEAEESLRRVLKTRG
jgi:uncharacterized membrane protein